MAIFFADLVREASWSEGAGAMTLAGALPGHRRFADAVPAEARFHYAIAGITRPEQWETGEGTLDGEGRLVREPAASSSGGTVVSFAPGLKAVALTVNADWFAAAGGGETAIEDIEGLVAALAGKAGLAGAAFSGAISASSLSLGNDLAIADGGTGASSAGAARSNLGLGSLATQAAGAVAISGGTIGGLASLGVGTSAPLPAVELRGDVGAYAGDAGQGAQLYLGDPSFASVSLFDSAPGIGAIADGSGKAGKLGLFAHGGAPNSRVLVAEAGNGAFAVQGSGSFGGAGHKRIRSYSDTGYVGWHRGASLGAAEAWYAGGGSHYFSIGGATALQLSAAGAVLTGALSIGGDRVVETRRTGWSAPTGTASRAPFDTSSVTTEALAERLKALIDDLFAHGLIGG